MQGLMVSYSREVHPFLRSKAPRREGDRVCSMFCFIIIDIILY